MHGYDGLGLIDKFHRQRRRHLKLDERFTGGRRQRADMGWIEGVVRCLAVTGYFNDIG
jgi:hypothetical protein